MLPNLPLELLEKVFNHVPEMIPRISKIIQKDFEEFFLKESLAKTTEYKLKYEQVLANPKGFFALCCQDELFETARYIWNAYRMTTECTNPLVSIDLTSKNLSPIVRFLHELGYTREYFQKYPEIFIRACRYSDVSFRCYLVKKIGYSTENIPKRYLKQAHVEAYRRRDISVSDYLLWMAFHTGMISF